MNLFHSQNGMVVKTFQAIAFIVLLLAVADVLILFTALGQIALEGRTGYWNGFWLTQAKFVLQFVR